MAASATRKSWQPKPKPLQPRPRTKLAEERRPGQVLVPVLVPVLTAMTIRTIPVTMRWLGLNRVPASHRHSPRRVNPMTSACCARRPSTCSDAPLQLRVAVTHTTQPCGDRSKVLVKDLDRLPPPWFPDHVIRACQMCARGFGMFRRKHHCRRCGRCVCSSCAPEKCMKTIPEFGYKDKVRHCVDCFDLFAI